MPETPFKITPFKVDPWHENATEALKLEENLRVTLQLIAENQTRDISFVQNYNIAYNMVLFKRGAALREMTDNILSKLSLVSCEQKYNATVRLFYGIVEYGERVHKAALLKTRPPLLKLADDLFKRDVARRWRRLCRHAWWIGLIAKCIVVFNTYAFAPNAAVPMARANEFYHLANGGKIIEEELTM